MDSREERCRFFYSDESFIELAGLPHIIIGSLEFHDPQRAAWEVVKLKKQIGLEPFEEIKWNSKLEAEKRHQLTTGILPILHRCTGFIAVVEGKNKTKAAETSLKQLTDYCVNTNTSSFTVYMDENLVEAPKSFASLVKRKFRGRPGCIGLQFMNSSTDQLIQCCDIFVGLYRAGIRYSLEGDKNIEVEDKYGDRISSNLLGFLELSTRGLLWGEYTEKDENGRPMFLDSWDMGFRMYSSIPEEKQKTMGVGFAKVYVGPRC